MAAVVAQVTARPGGICAGMPHVRRKGGIDVSHAPAGWYKDPRDSGAPRYWTGEAWLAPGERPAADILPSQQAGAFTPAAAAPTSAGYAPTPVPSHSDPSAMAEPHAYNATAGDWGASGDQEVAWDVVGMPRKPDAASTSPSSGQGWSPETYPPHASAPEGYAPQGYAPPTYAATTYTQGVYTAPIRHLRNGALVGEKTPWVDQGGSRCRHRAHRLGGAMGVRTVLRRRLRR